MGSVGNLLLQIGIRRPWQADGVQKPPIPEDKAVIVTVFRVEDECDAFGNVVSEPETPPCADGCAEAAVHSTAIAAAMLTATPSGAIVKTAAIRKGRPHRAGREVRNPRDN